MIAFAAIKGIFFSGSFCAIFWLKKRGLMPSLGFSNKLISHNKGLNCDFACLLYSKLTNCLPKKRIINNIRSAVDINMEFVVDALPVELIGMNLIMMCNYNMSWVPMLKFLTSSAVMLRLNKGLVRAALAVMGQGRACMRVHRGRW
jgi:ribonucleotide reductase beta subunit family protein with ferritin-like domain